MTTPNPGKTRSVQRALLTLEAVSRSRSEIGISELSTIVGLPASTVHRILATLVDIGYIIQNPETGRYRVGLRAFEVGNAFLRQTSLTKVARPVMRDLADELNESINLAVPDGDAAVYIDQVESDQLLKLFTRSGSRVALYGTGVGKVLLASRSTEEIERYIRETEFAARTSQTITGGDELSQRLHAVRQLGYAVDDEEFEVGVRCIAVPIRDHRGETIAALSMSGPSQRIPHENIEALAARLLEAAHAISTSIGFAAAELPDAEEPPQG